MLDSDGCELDVLSPLRARIENRCFRLWVRESVPPAVAWTWDAAQLRAAGEALCALADQLEEFMGRVERDGWTAQRREDEGLWRVVVTSPLGQMWTWPTIMGWPLCTKIPEEGLVETVLHAARGICAWPRRPEDRRPWDPLNG